MNECGPGLLWTPVPLEQVLATSDTAAPAWVEVQIGGRIFQVLPAGGSTGVIQRLISSDPGDYLNPRWQPGSLVRLP